VNEHTITAFDADLRNLTRMISEQGGVAEKMVADSTEALSRRDPGLACRVLSMDATIDLLQREIEDAAIVVIAKRQPVASDLREVIGAIRVANDLERIGDLANNNAKRVIALGGVVPVARMTGLDAMSLLALSRLKSVLTAFVQRDVAAAIVVWRSDGEIDALHNSLFRELITYMMEDPRSIGASAHLLFCAKNLERIGDHATNIAETVHYVVTGNILTEERPKLDTTSVMPAEG
jgi:phosphate transport system protein